MITTFSRFFHIASCINTSFLGKYFLAWTDHIFFIHSSGDGPVGGFYPWATVNSAAMSMGAQVFVGTPASVL